TGTFVNICIIVLANYLIDIFISFPSVGNLVEILSKVIAIAFLLIFFGEILPKVWATQNNIRFAYGASFMVESLHLMLRRVSRRVVKLAEGIGKRLGANRTEKMSIRELDEA